MSQDTKTIFISYGRDEENPQDVELVRKMKSALQKEGFMVLMDEEQLRTTNDWASKLEHMILQSQWVLYFITPYSARRPYGFCLRELTKALEYNVSIAPVMLRQEALPIEICRLQYLDLQALRDDEDYHKKLTEIIAVLRGENELGFEGEHLRVLSELEPIKFETTISKHSKGFRGREWVYEEVDRWLKEEENSRVLCILAEAGFGKSAIATYLAKTHPSATSVHFCQYDYGESRESKEMLKVLIYELSTQLVEYHKILQTLNIKEALGKSAEHIFTQLLLEPLQQISKPEKKHFFVIDALDEADNSGKNQIVDLISNRFLDLPLWLNIVITSRPEPKLLRKLKKFNSAILKVEDTRNKSDLELLLGEPEIILSEKVVKKPEVLQKIKQALSDRKIVESLIKKSEGNILYLKSIFALDVVEDGELTLKTIEKFPNGMGELYLNTFERYFGEISEYKKWQRPLFELMIRANEALSIELIMDTLDWDDYDIGDALESVGSIIEKKNNSISFFNKSIVDWLANKENSGIFYVSAMKGGERFDKKIDGMNSSEAVQFFTKYPRAAYYLSQTNSDYWTNRLLYIMCDPEVENSRFMKELILNLNKTNFVSVNTGNHMLIAGSDWEKELENNMSLANKALIFMTPSSVRRPDGFCLNELVYCLMQKKKIIPIMFKHITPPLAIARLKYLDFTHMNNTHDKEKFNELISALEEE